MPFDMGGDWLDVLRRAGAGSGVLESPPPAAPPAAPGSIAFPGALPTNDPLSVLRRAQQAAPPTAGAPPGVMGMGAMGMPPMGGGGGAGINPLGMPGMLGLPEDPVIAGARVPFALAPQAPHSAPQPDIISPAQFRQDFADPVASRAQAQVQDINENPPEDRNRPRGQSVLGDIMGQLSGRLEPEAAPTTPAERRARLARRQGLPRLGQMLPQLLGMQ